MNKSFYAPGREAQKRRDAARAATMKPEPQIETPKEEVTEEEPKPKVRRKKKTVRREAE